MTALETITNYTTIFGTVISLFFALYAIKLSIQQSRDRTQINKLQELVENVQKENTLLFNILVHTKEQNKKILSLDSISRFDLKESKRQTRAMSSQLSIATNAANLALLDFEAENRLSEYAYLNAQAILINSFISAKRDSSNWNIYQKLEFLKKIDSVTKSQLNNKMILTESFGIQWYNLDTGIRGLLEKLVQIDSQPQSRYNEKRKELMIRTNFPEMISRLKLITEEKFIDSRENLINEEVKKYNNEK